MLTGDSRFYDFFLFSVKKEILPEKSFSGGSINWKRLCACERLPLRLEKLCSLSSFGFLLSRHGIFSRIEVLFLFLLFHYQ